jgi:hypothetical protein
MSVSLVSVADVRAFLQKPDPDQQQDGIIGRLIEHASDAVMTYCEREFAPATAAGVSRQFYYCGNGVLNLTPYDVQVVTQVKIDTIAGTGGTVLASTDYRLYPTPAKDGVYNWLRLSPSITGSPSITFREREVTITGTWGFPAVPDDVKHWTAVTVATWLRKDVQAFSTTFNIDEQRLERPEALPSAVRAGLYRYRM